jgi:hypothetical protein
VHAEVGLYVCRFKLGNIGYGLCVPKTSSTSCSAKTAAAANRRTSCSRASPQLVDTALIESDLRGDVPKPAIDDRAAIDTRQQIFLVGEPRSAVRLAVLIWPAMWGLSPNYNRRIHDRFRRYLAVHAHLGHRPEMPLSGHSRPTRGWDQEGNFLTFESDLSDLIIQALALGNSWS